MKTETVPISTLRKDPKNARAHPKRNLDAIKESLRTFGQQKPIVVDPEGQVIAGNGTLDAALALGWTEIEIVRSPLVGTTAKAYAIADNRTGELAAWNEEALAEALAEIQKDESLDAICTGFDPAEIEREIGRGAGVSVVEDEVPPLPAEAITKPGDLWIMGRNRLLCGDCTKGEAVTRVVGGERAVLLVTDPPYNLGESWNGLQTFRGNEQVANDDRPDWDAWMGGALDVWGTEALAENCSGYMWCCLGSYPRKIIEARGYRVHATIIWAKEHFNVGRADYHSQVEPCVYFSRGTRHWCGRRDLSDVWHADRVEQERVHPNQKPISLIARAIECSSPGAGSLVFDPFLGSGTTLIASEQLGRRCFGLEIEPRYCDVVVKRWQNLTGKEASRG